jgi:hypothetical protein
VSPFYGGAYETEGFGRQSRLSVGPGFKQGRSDSSTRPAAPTNLKLEQHRCSCAQQRPRLEKPLFR